MSTCNTANCHNPILLGEYMCPWCVVNFNRTKKSNEPTFPVLPHKQAKQEQPTCITPLPGPHTLPVGTIEATLVERGARYGAFKDHAVIAQDIQSAMRKPEGWNKLAPDQKQALTVIADKIARMLNGDPDYADNWHDIIGYAKLVEDRLNGKQ